MATLMSNRVDNYDDDDEDFDVPPSAGPSKPSRSAAMDVDEDPEDDEEDDEDDEEDEDDEDEDEDEEMERPKKKKRRSKKRSAISRFIDTEAVVDDEDEDLDDEEEGLGPEDRGFFAGDDAELDDNIVTAGHHRFARRQQEDEDQDLSKIAQDVTERYRRTARKYTGDTSDLPQQFLMPGVHDPSLWQIRVRPGKERELVFQLLRKSIDLQFTNRPLEIYSAFERDSLPGMIYVEARSQHHVKQAIDGLVGVFPSRGIVLVPIDEMASLLRIKKIETTITPGSWVRIKRGKYAGDLAQVLDVTDNGEEAGLKFIPRIDLTPREENYLNTDKKRKKVGANNAGGAPGYRPPQRFFNAEEVSKVYKNKVTMKPGSSRKFVFMGDTYNNGFIEKDVKIIGLITENVNPTLDEIARFTAGDNGDMDGVRNNQVDLSIIAADARKAATAVLQPGDHVEVFEGEQTGLNGTVESINGEVVVIRAKDVDIEGQKIEVPAASVRKKFKAGDHIKVMTGTNADETGLVVSVLNDTVTFLSDMSMQEVTVFAKDVREAAEVGAGTNIVGNYELHDLVQLDQQTVGVIYKTERDSFRVLDQNGQTRLVHPHQITMRKDSRRAIATDSQGYEIRIGDNMKEVDGEGRKGSVVHIHQTFYAFLHNREIVENGGVFVTRARSLASVAPKGRSGGPDLTKLNPAMAGGMVGSGMTTKGPRDPLVGVQIVVVQGQFKGYLGRIKDTNGNFARVELHTQNKVITTEKSKLKRKGADGKVYPLEQSATFNMPAGKGNMGHMGPPSTPNSYSRATPNPYSGGGGTTPGRPNVPGRTPNPYVEGGRTPGFPNDGGRTPGSNAWSANARTPNPYGRTPNPYNGGGGGGGGGDGGRTPGRFNDGGRTPGSGSVWRPNGGMTPNPHRDPRAPVGRTPAGAGASASDAHDPWATDDYPISAPTPGAMNAPTPGVFARDEDTWAANTAPTPGGWGAPTPYSAPTPGISSAPTPGFHATPGPSYARTPGLSAPTPGITAPTPGPGSSWHDPVPHRDDHWLFGCSDIWVTIGPDANGKHWINGDFDGEQVMVISVQDYSLNSAGLENTANVRFPDSSTNSGLQREVPLNYLHAVRPKVGETAMVVNMNSDMRHSFVKVTQMSAEMAWFQEADVRPGLTARDGAIPLEDLVKAVGK